MALSKETRIIIFIVIDVAFFLLEIIIGKHQLLVLEACLDIDASPGYTAHSLALVADAFHMVRLYLFYAQFGIPN